jgi:hypothetical protein
MRCWHRRIYGMGSGVRAELKVGNTVTNRYSGKDIGLKMGNLRFICFHTCIPVSEVKKVNRKVQYAG